MHPAGEPGTPVQEIRPLASATTHGAHAVSEDPTLGPAEPVDLRQEMRDAAEFLSRSGPAPAAPTSVHRASRTSDLSIDEELALHSIGWEPVHLVCGASLYSVPTGVWNWGQGEITYASNAYAQAFAGSRRPHPRGVHEDGWAGRGRRPGGGGGPSPSRRRRRWWVLRSVRSARAGCPPIPSSSPTSPAAISPSCTPRDGYRWVWRWGPASSTPPGERRGWPSSRRARTSS